MYRLLTLAVVCCVFAGCGGDDAAGKNMSVSGGTVDEPTRIAQEANKVKADPKNPNVPSGAKQGGTSGGGTGTAILD